MDDRTDEALILREDAGAVATLTLNNPAKLNPLSDEMIAALTGTFAALKEDRATRVVVLKGAGKAFCAGHDLRQMQAGRQSEDAGAAYFADLFGRCAAMMSAIRALPQPVIAQVHGVAAAAGCQLVAACDLAVAAETTRFGVNGVNIGLFCSTPMVALSRNVSPKQAFEMLVTGELIGAARAREIGLVNRVVPEDGLGEATAELAALIAGKLGKAVAIGKEAFYAQLGRPLDQAYALTGKVMAANMMLGDTAGGIEAFLNKQKPVWDQ